MKGFEMPPLCDEMPAFSHRRGGILRRNGAISDAFTRKRHILSPAGDFAFIYRRPSFHPRNACVALPEEPDWCKARPICRLRASRFALGIGTCRTCATCRTFSISGIGLGEVCMGQEDVVGLWNWHW